VSLAVIDHQLAVISLRVKFVPHSFARSAPRKSFDVLALYNSDYYGRPME